MQPLKDNKDVFIKFRCTSEEKYDIEHQAAIEGMPVSEFIRKKINSDGEPVNFIYESHDLDYMIERLGLLAQDMQNILRGVEYTDNVNRADIKNLNRKMDELLDIYQKEFMKEDKKRESAQGYARKMVREWKKQQKEKKGEKGNANNEST